MSGVGVEGRRGPGREWERLERLILHGDGFGLARQLYRSAGLSPDLVGFCVGLVSLMLIMSW